MAQPSTTFALLQADCQGALADTTSDTLTRIKRSLNRAASDLWYRFPWIERRTVGYVSTLEPYSTGTITFTNGSAAVTGSGTTWTAAMTGMKIAKSYQGPWYTFTRTGATTGTLDRNYVEATESGATYVIYQDVYALASDCDSVLSREVALHRTGGWRLLREVRANAEAAMVFPVGPGIPDYFHVHTRNSSGYLTIKVGPSAPSAVFSIRVPYLLTYTEMSGDSDLCVLHERYRHILVDGALSELYLLYNRPDLAQAALQRFEERGAIAFSRQANETPDAGIIRSFDQAFTGSVQSVLPVTQP